MKNGRAEIRKAIKKKTKTIRETKVTKVVVERRLDTSPGIDKDHKQENRNKTETVKKE